MAPNPIRMLICFLLLFVYVQIGFATAKEEAGSTVYDPSRSFYLWKRVGPTGVFVLNGEINPELVRQVKEAIAIYDQSPLGASKYPMSGNLNSLGGDVASAMEIGRILRNQRATLLVNRKSQCASACVLIFAAGVDRTALGPIIVHRPYFSEAAPGEVQVETQAKYQAARIAVMSYLQSMNVAPELWDAMATTSPSNARTLSSEKMVRFGLIGTDPVEDEMRRQKYARYLQISIQEHVTREAMGKRNCTWVSNDNGSDEHDGDEGECQSYFMFGGKNIGLTTTGYAQRSITAREKCDAQVALMKSIEDRNIFVSCMARILGNASP